MSMMIKASATIVREIGCDLALAHQSSSDPHAASLGTTLQLIENVAQHVVNFFAIAPAAEFKQSDEDDPERLAFLHATDGLLYEVLSTPASLLELSRKLSSTADSIVATASSQESKCLKETFSSLCVVVELASGRITVKQFAQLRRCAYDTFARLSRTNTHHAVQTEAIKLLTMVVEAGAGGSSPRLPAAEVDFGRTLEAIERCTARTTAGQGARGGALRLLGTLANAYPAEAVAFLGQILQTFRRSMEDMIAKSEPDQLAGEGVMLGLTALLHHFGSHEATEAALGSLMFPFVRGALHVTLDPQQTAQQRYRFTKATLKFLKYHAMYMRVALHGEAVTMFRVLRSLCGHKNVDLHKEAYPAAMSFLEAYAFTACHQSPPAQPSLLPQLIQMAKESLLRVDVEPYELSIAVSSFGALARPMAQLLTPVEMVEVFRELSGKSQALLEASEAEMESATRYLPQFLSTYAAIIYEIVPDALIHSSHGQAVMNAVEQLVDSVLLLFPRQYYFPKQRAATPLALMKLFLACTRHPVVLGRVCTRFVERGLTLSIGSSSMFRETVTSSGSHTLQRLDTLDADRVDTAPPIPSDQQEGALYDEYMPLWHGLLTINTDVAKWSYPWKESLRDEEVMSHCHAIRWELMRCISQSIKVLDLHCTTQAAPNVSGVQPDHSALGAGGASISPRNPKDYSLFLCLVPFFSKVALALFDTACGDDELLVNTGEWGLVLARACIDRSCLWPHVSGYYTIVESLLTALPKEVLRRQGDLSAALLNFHEVAIRRIPDCSRELLFACVSCLAAYPAPQLITVDQLAAPLKTLLQLGLEYEPAATRAIQTLSTVLDPHRANEVPTSLLSSVLPFLTSYVAQQNNQLEDVTRSHIAQRATELIGHAGLRLASAMEDPHVDDDLTTQMHALQLDPDHTLRLVLPFRDTVVEVPVGMMIPRVLVLIAHPVRQTRIAACELLHAVVLWVVGTVNLRPLDAPGDPADVLRALFPAVLELSASTDTTVSELFTALATQLAHWYAQCPCHDAVSSARGVSQFLDAAFQGLRGGSRGVDAAIRTSSATVISEFLRWAAKNPRNNGADQTRLALRRLAGLCHHPSSHERLGAATCFNRFYPVFREMHSSVISEHTLDVLYHLLSALLLEADESASGATTQLKDSIVHMEKIIVFHSALLVAPDASRSGQLSTLPDAVTWLFQQCGSTQKLCRSLAMRLFTTFASCLPGFETEDGPSRWLVMSGQTTDIFSGVYDAFSLQDPHLKVIDHRTSLSLPAFMEWGKELEASIACHLWLLAARYMSPFVAFGRQPERPSKKLRTEAVLGGHPVSSAQRGAEHGKSQLPAHLWAFLHALTLRKVQTATVDSQAVWLDGAEGPEVPTMPMGRAMCSQVLSVLEAAASLYEVLVERFPTCVWRESDIDPAERHTSFKPLLHEALYKVTACLALSPQSILGNVSVVGEARRVDEIALRLSKVCWVGSQGNTDSALQERSTLEAAISAVVPAALRSEMPVLCQSVAENAAAYIALVSGLRTLGRVGCSLTHAVANRGAPITERLQQCVTYVNLNRHLLSSPLMQTFVVEFIGLLLQIGVDPHALVDLVLEEEQRSNHVESSRYLSQGASLVGASSGVLQRMSTGALALHQLQVRRRLWGGILRGELEVFLSRYRDAILSYCLGLLRQSRPLTPDGQVQPYVIQLLRQLLLCVLRTDETSDPVADMWLKLFQVSQDDESGERDASQLLALRVDVAVAFLQPQYRTPHSAAVFEKVLCDLQLLLNPSTWACKRHELLRSPSAARWLTEGAKVAELLSKRDELIAHAVGNDHGSSTHTTLRTVLQGSVEALLMHELPLSWEEVPLGSTEWDTYRNVIRQGVVEMLPSTARIYPALLFEILPLLADRTHPLRGLMIAALDKAISSLSTAQLPEVVQMCFQKQNLALPLVVRQSITHHITLPCIRRLPPDALAALYAEHVGELYRQVEATGYGTTETIAAANTLCVTRTCAFVLLATMYRLCSADALRGEVNKAFVASSLTQAPATGKELTEKLLRCSLQARSFQMIAGLVTVDTNLLFQYRQAAFTCLVSVVVATQRQEKLFVEFLLRERNQDLWHKIVDCNVQHYFAVETRFDEVPQQLSAVRTDWELQSRTAALSPADSSSQSSTSQTPESQQQYLRRQLATGGRQRTAGTRRVRYLSSQYLQDSHLGAAFEHTDGLEASPPVAIQGQSDRFMEDVVNISATPKHHRDTIKASMQYELDHSTRGEDEGVAGHHAATNAQPFDHLAASTSSHVDMSARDGMGVALLTGDASIELDSVWLSSCSNTLLFLLDALIRLFPSSAPSAGYVVELSQSGAASVSWVQSWLSVFTSPDTHRNVKLVLLRLMTLRADFFDRFATELFEPLVELAVDPSLGKGIHYVCRDILLLFLRWRTSLPPHHPTSEAVANKLVSHLVRNISHKTRRVIRNNFEMLKLLIEKWRGRCHVHKKDVLGWLSYDDSLEGAHIARMCGVQVCGVLAANEVPVYSLRYDSGVVAEDVFMKRLVHNLSFINKDVAVACAEVVGMTLHYLHKISTTLDDRTATLRAATSEKLWSMYSTAKPDRFLIVLRRVAEHFPDVLDEFLPAKIMNLFHALTNSEDQVLVFELYGMRCERAEVLFPAIHAHLAALHTMRPLLKVALYQLLLLLFPRLSPGLLGSLVKAFLQRRILDTNLRDVVDARVAFYRMCIGITEQRHADLEAAHLQTLRGFLVLGLEDSSVFIRDLLIRYWDHEDRLSTDGSARFSQLFSKVLYAATSNAATEATPHQNEELSDDSAEPVASANSSLSRSSSAWVQHAAILMLSLCHRSPDFSRSDALFPQPLKHCHFRAAPLKTSNAMNASLSTLAPMFSSQVPVALLSRTPASLGGYVTRRVDGDDPTTSSQMLSGQLVATQQNRLFPATQEGLFTVFSRTVAPSSTQSQLLFRTTVADTLSASISGAAKYAATVGPAASLSQRGSAGVELKRRFIATTEDDAVRTHIMHASRLRQERTVHSQRQREQQTQQVTLYRTYRSGEVPDVQIALQSLVIPWQALLLHDPELARVTITALGRSLMNSVRDVATSASAPKPGGPLSHTAPASTTTFLVDIPGALSVQVARQTHDELQRLLLDVFHPRRMWQIPRPVAHVCQELLLSCASWDATRRPGPTSAHSTAGTPLTAMQLPSPEHIVGSAMPRAGEPTNNAVLCSALLLLEHQLPHDMRTRPSPPTPAARQAWSAYSLMLLHHQEVHKGHRAARKLLPAEWKAGFAEYLTQRSTGNWEGAWRQCRTLLDADTITSADALSYHAVRFEASEALSSMLRWDDVAINVPMTELVQHPPQVLLTTKLHEAQLAVHAHVMMRVRWGPHADMEASLLDRLPTDAFSLQRALEMMAAGDYSGAAEAARRGIRDTGLSFETSDGSASHRAGLIALHTLTTVASGAEALVFMKARPREALAVLHKRVVQFVSSVPPTFVADAPLQWDYLLATMQLLTEHTKREFQSTAKAEIPPQIAEDLASLQQSLFLTAAEALSESSHGVLAGKNLLSRPASLLKLELSQGTAATKAAARYHVWATVMHTTSLRVFHVPPATPANTSLPHHLRKTWSELVTAVRKRRESDSALTTGVVSIDEHAGLESRVWTLFLSSLLAHEGCNPSNAAELVAMCVKAHDKTLTYSTWLLRAAQLLSECSQGGKALGTLDSATLAKQEKQLLQLLHVQDQVLRQHSDVSGTGFIARAAVALHFAQLLLRLVIEFHSVDAQRMFPRLLELISDEANAGSSRPIGQLLAESTPRIPTASVLPWCAQILSALTRPNTGAAVALLARRLALHHPQVVLYPFQCARDDLLASAASAPPNDVVAHTIHFLATAFAQEPTLGSVRLFVSELHMLHNPELRARQWLNELRRIVPGAGAGQHKAQEVFQRMWTDCFELNTSRGAVNAQFAKKYEKTVRTSLCHSETSLVLDATLVAGDVRVWKSTIDKLATELRPLVETSGLQPLAAFSLELGRLQLSQYGSDYILLPQQPDMATNTRATRIVGFDANVLVLSSQQKPKRIKLHTSSEDTHMMLVKGGEDLRLDQRVQQLFTSINLILQSCRSKRVPEEYHGYPLTLRTYPVIPVSKRMGLIGWVPNTVVLKELIERRMKADPYVATDVAHHPATREYRSIFETPGANVLERYLLLFRDARNTNNQYVQRMENIVAMTNPAYLADGLRGLASTAAQFYDIRGRWATSVGALSVASYVLGIGDRHLENFLVDRSSGTMISIDFGHAFGSATTALPIPELVPFRLSPQMLHALGPLGTDSIAGPMVTTMSALYQHRGFLQTLVATFLHEPLLDWEGSSKITSKSDGEAPVVGSDVAATKLESFYRKLRLEHPAEILATELAKNHKVRHYGVIDDVARVARGDPLPRTATGVQRLSPNEFVETLLEMSTDLNVLGRTWAGWSPVF